MKNLLVFLEGYFEKVMHIADYLANIINKSFCFDKILLLAYYILLYIAYIKSEIPAPQHDLWRFYFPVKSVLIAMALICSNTHLVVVRSFTKKIHDYDNLLVVIAVSFIIGIIIPSVIVQCILNEIGIDLWFLVS